VQYDNVQNSLESGHNAPNVSRKVSRIENVQNHENLILKYLQNRESANAKEIAAIIGKTDRTARRFLDKMIGNGKIRMLNGGRSTRYALK
jgi:predicted ArsR family transcriptional regulator